MDIVVISQYLRNIENFEGNNSRFVYLAKLLARNTENKVEIVTSDFSHGSKAHFEKTGELPEVKVTVVHESGYPKNICLKRIASHKELAKNIGCYLENRQKPDVCYCAVPSLDVADVVAKYCDRNEVRFIVDIQDLWPEAFKMAVNIPVVSDLAFAPMERQANRIYAKADHIVAVSQTYADRAVRVNPSAGSTVVFLGTEMDTFDLHAQAASPRSGDGIVRLAYIGTLGHSYDIPCVLEAMRKLPAEDLAQIEFVVMGGGPLKETFESLAEGLPVRFTGPLPYPDMVRQLIRCDVAMNPIVHGSAGSIINKVGDYAMAGLPVINTQESAEYRKLVEDYHCGINCPCGDTDSVAAAIQRLLHDGELRRQMGQNSRKLAEERFDRKETYRKLAELICQ